MQRSLPFVTTLFIICIMSMVVLFAAEKEPSTNLSISASSSIRLEVIIDINGNGIKDNSDTLPLPPGIFAYLETKRSGTHYSYDTLGNGVLSTTLTNLTSGTYQVIENLPYGWIATLAASYNGSSVDTVRFLNFKLGSISGNVFDDIDGDSIKDIGEEGLSGWTISCNGTMLGNISTVTDSLGNYSIDSLGSGSHTITLASQTGWNHTIPASGSYSVNILSGDDLTGLNFGNRGIYSVSGFITTESYLLTHLQRNNLHGLYKQGDPIRDVGVSLGKKPNPPSIIYHSVSDDSGRYLFTNISPGDYELSLTLPPGASIAFPLETTYTITLSGNESFTNLNFRLMFTPPDAEWRIIPSGTTINLNAVGFFDEDNAVAIGDSGTIIRSTDGGVTWNPAFIDTTFSHAKKLLGGGDPLKGLNLPPPPPPQGGGGNPCGEKGKSICVGGGGNIYKTTDIGATWHPINSGTSANLQGITSLNDSDMVAVGENFTLLYSSNGGDSWLPATLVIPPQLLFQKMGNTVSVPFKEGEDVYKENPCKALLKKNESVSPAQNLIAVGENGIILKSSDKGVTWIYQTPFTGNSFYAGTGFDNHGVFIAGDSTFVQSSDGGLHWNISSDHQGTIRNVSIINGTSAYAVGDNGRILFSTDNGTTWTTEGSPSANNLTGVASTPFSDGYARVTLAVGENGLILRKIERVGVSVNISVSDYWNLVSVPVLPLYLEKDSVFRFSRSDAFAYENGYAPTNALTPGKGYWLKFNGARTNTLNGAAIEAETVDVSAKWNIIGSITTEIQTSSITSIPPGLITSQAFGYGNGGYSPASSLVPGKGYWVKCSGNGKLILSSTVLGTASNKIQIVPTSELPPPPPEVSENYDNSTMPDEYALAQNYPNPFNPTTVINYQIPDVGAQRAVFINLRIYSTLGQEITTLVDEMQEPGFKSVTFDASSIPSGMYFYRLTAGNWSDTKKLLLMK